MAVTDEETETFAEERPEDIHEIGLVKSKLPPVGHPAWYTSGPDVATFYESRQTTEISDNQSAVTVYHSRRDNDENWLLQIH
ncbi:hypothetical protein M0802_007347 [Mischocyttarus mexicanus]|nr:hypothetical protein M0802_007347 [Mischocyttarus mexicanus]